MSSARLGRFLRASGSPSPGMPEGSVFRREPVARQINAALQRLDLVLYVLETVDQGVIPAIGDSLLKNGCQRAVTSMLFALAGLSPAGPSLAHPGLEERLVKAKLVQKRLERLLDQEQLEYLDALVRRLLP
ncbi:MAG: hypothetical protein QM680_12475 [Luteolibacter sp.]